MALVSITTKKKVGPSSCPFRNGFSVALLDKFFLVGSIAGLFGSVGLGAFVWLQRSGLLGIAPNYQSMRSLHATMQFYLFLTPFILGFFIQSAPKLFGSQKPLHPAVQLSLPGTIGAAIVLAISPGSYLASTILALCCGGLAASILPAFAAASREIQLRLGILCLIGLGSLGIGAFSDLGNPVTSLLLFWFGIVAIILATAQQFIAGVLGGSYPSTKSSTLTLILFLVTGTVLLISRGGNSLSSALALATFINFLHSTGAHRMFGRIGRDPLALAFTTAHFWALAGSALLAFGTIQTDSVLHIWGIGYAMTLTMAISLRLISWMSHTAALSDRWIMILLALWQTVPFVRGLQGLYPFPSYAVLLSFTCACFVLICWTGAICKSVFIGIRNQLELLQVVRAQNK